MNWQRVPRQAVVIVCLLLAASGAALAYELNLINELGDQANDVREPRTTLVLSGDTLYGMTTRGGANEGGTLFSVKTDGSDFGVLYDFENGSYPFGNIVVSGTKIYGTTHYNGANGYGMVYSIDTDGSDFDSVYDFASGADNGRGPSGVSFDGTYLYGATYGGGDADVGTIYKVKTDGTEFSLLHEFGGWIGYDGSNPYSAPMISGSTLYGAVPWNGPTRGDGMIYSIGTDGSGYAALHEFDEATDGKRPYMPPVSDGTYLYGMTTGSTSGGLEKGNIYKMRTDGTEFEILHEFAGLSDGRYAECELALEGDVLFGMTRYGGQDDNGVLFRIDTDGTGFWVIHHFAGGTSDGNEPWGTALTPGGSLPLYGVTFYGGTSDNGVVFALVPEPSSCALMIIGAGAVVALRRRRRTT